MQITSSAFQNNEPLDARYSKDGENINPPLTFSEIPDKTASLALIVEDPDAVGGTFTHWIVYNMSPATVQIVEGELPMSGVEGMNGAGALGYYGPQPPAGTGTHSYFFKLFALDTMLDFDNSQEVDRAKFYEAIDGHAIDQVEIIGLYSAPDSTDED